MFLKNKLGELMAKCIYCGEKVGLICDDCASTANECDELKAEIKRLKKLLEKQGEKKSLPEEILDLFKKRMKMEYEYINPHFMQEITGPLYDYYKLEDDDVDAWIIEMFGA